MNPYDGGRVHLPLDHRGSGQIQWPTPLACRHALGFFVFFLESNGFCLGLLRLSKNWVCFANSLYVCFALQQYFHLRDESLSAHAGFVFLFYVNDCTDEEYMLLRLLLPVEMLYPLKRGTHPRPV